jgi:DNA polymerase-3 subunit delta
MKSDLTQLISKIKSGTGTRCLLLFGDDLRVQEISETIIGSLVPEDTRGFNLERFDGRKAQWDRVHASLMTPPFFQGTKVVWIEDAPYFASREQKAELSERILQLWGNGKQEEASKLLVDLLAVEGWTQEQWDYLEPGATRELSKLLAAEDDHELDKLLAFCKTQEVDLNRRTGARSEALEVLLDQGLPSWSFLLLTAIQVDRRMRLYKKLDELGGVLHLGLERDRSGKVSREKLLEFIKGRMRQAGKTADPPVQEMIVQRAPSDLRSFSQELEKLFLYVGERSALRAQDVEIVISYEGEGWVFDLTRAISERNPQAAFSQLARLISRGEHPLKLLGAMASEARRLLAARELLDGDLRGHWRSGMSYQQFQREVPMQGAAQLTRNPYADYMCLMRADRVSTAEVRHYLDSIYDADARLKSSGNNPRLVLERLMLAMCVGKKKIEAGVTVT